MAGLRKTIANLGRFRRRFERLLAAVRKRPGAEAPSARLGRLREITGFGSNPGNLRMFAYLADRLPRAPGLVVALHGCTQTAAGYDYGTGWSTLADRLGFLVVYPEQQPSNNPKSCFSWFLRGDSARDRGEALSIRQMVERAIEDFGVDRRRVFVTGFSAGGAMASVMLATYPEVFAGGAIIAGLPYGCAASVEEAFEAMFKEHAGSARALGERVRAASRHHGPWPKVSVWHGSSDPIVRPSNAEDIVRQWAHVHGLSAPATHKEVVAGHLRRVWIESNGNEVIETFSISGMAHGVPLATGISPESCGAAGPFFLNVGISSSHHIAKFWGLSEDRAAAGSVAAEVAPASAWIGASAREIEVAARAGSGSIEPTEAPFEWSKTHEAPWPLDPNVVIAAAFKAAGLPVPEIPSQPPGATPPVAPGPIIEAALKAAGLIRR